MREKPLAERALLLLYDNCMTVVAMYYRNAVGYKRASRHVDDIMAASLHRHQLKSKKERGKGGERGTCWQPRVNKSKRENEGLNKSENIEERKYLTEKRVAYYGVISFLSLKKISISLFISSCSYKLFFIPALVLFFLALSMCP